MKRLLLVMIGGATVGGMLAALPVLLVLNFGDQMADVGHRWAFRLSNCAMPVDASGMVPPAYAAQVEARLKIAAESDELAELRDASADTKAAQRYLADFHGTPKRGR